MNKKYIVRLSVEEREYLNEIITKGKTAAYKIRHAHILLKADADGPDRTDEKIAEIFSVHKNTVSGIRQRLAEEGIESAPGRKKQEKPGQLPKSDGEKEARVIALGCGSPPDGYARRTLRLPADKIAETGICDSVSHETVRQTLKKMS